MWTCIVADWDTYGDNDPKFDVREFELKSDAVDQAIEAMGSCDRGQARYGLCDHFAHAAQTQRFGCIIVACLFEGTLSKSELVAAYPKMKCSVGYCDC